MTRLALAALSALFAVACASQSTEDEPADSEGALATSNEAASERFEKQLFDDVQPAGEVRNYTLMGNVPGSHEACRVTIHRASLHPSQYNWSMLTVTPLGHSAATVNEHGPVEIGWAYNGASSAKLDLDVNGNTAVWSETVNGAMSGQPKKNWTIAGTLKFRADPHRYDNLASVKILGDNSVGTHMDAACENLKATFEMTKDAIKTVEKARDKWGVDNGEDVSELEYEGCELSSTKRLDCQFGNETNEEQLAMSFEIVDGKIGRMLHADRTSDFH